MYETEVVISGSEDIDQILTELPDDACGNAWVEVTRGYDGCFWVTIIGYLYPESGGCTDGIWLGRVDGDNDLLAEVIDRAIIEAARLDGGGL